ncbi:MAG: hypothetical protein IIB39_09355 [Candidatus Marinimicrobia bacterium]|nr:hypothetical protein [Candidatus Neomarinimicrobiota bacterium]
MTEVPLLSKEGIKGWLPLEGNLLYSHRMEKSLTDKVISNLRLHGLIWAVMIPAAYISFIAIRFFHEVIGHGLIGTTFGMQWNGFGLTSSSVTIPSGASVFSQAVYHLSGHFAVFLAGIVLFKFVSRRIHRPSLRFLLIMVATLCFLTTTLPAALIFWVGNSDYVTLLQITGFDSFVFLLLFSFLGTFLFFYTGSYSITRLLEEAWTGLDSLEIKYSTGFLTLGVPLNVILLFLIYYFYSWSPNDARIILSAVMLLGFNFMLPSVSSHVIAQPGKRRIKKFGLLIITGIALVIGLIQYSTMGKMILWSEPDSAETAQLF